MKRLIVCLLWLFGCINLELFAMEQTFMKAPCQKEEAEEFVRELWKERILMALAMIFNWSSI